MEKKQGKIKLRASTSAKTATTLGSLTDFFKAATPRLIKEKK